MFFNEVTSLDFVLFQQIAGVNYGGHVTDDWDRRLLMTYVNDAFNDAVITEPFHKLSANVYYYIPKDGPIYSYREFISMLPNIDNPDAFGQNPNADIASQIRETRLFYWLILLILAKFLFVSIASVCSASLKRFPVFKCWTTFSLIWCHCLNARSKEIFSFLKKSVTRTEGTVFFFSRGYKNCIPYISCNIHLFSQNRNLFETLLSLQPQVSSGTQGERPEDKVLDLAADVLKKVPDTIDYDQTAKILAEDPAPLNVVLLQEVLFEPFVSVSFKFILSKKQMFLEFPESFAFGEIIKI